MKLKVLFLLLALTLPLGTQIHSNSSKSKPSKIIGVIKQDPNPVFFVSVEQVIKPKTEKFPDYTANHNAAVAADQAKAAAQEAARIAEAQKQAAQAAVANSQPSAPVDENGAKMFIYLHESGNNPTRANSSGCLGLGQACPGSKLTRVCPNLDYACEDAFFTSYMLGRYGTWENAKAFWLSHNWW